MKKREKNEFFAPKCMSPFVTLLQMITGNTQSAKKHNINAFVVNTTCFLTDVFLGLMVHYSIRML